MKKYIYNADIGTFSIQQIRHYLYQLWIKEEMLGEYESAQKAAQDVAQFNTDYVEWDKLENKVENVPADLSDWTPVPQEE